jgi:nicotinamide mononucleotide transporter
MRGGFAEALLTSIQQTDTITWIATVTAVLYVILALKESVWCWSFGIVTSALWVSVYFHERLWYESILNIFYVVLGVYGWISWAKEKNNRGQDDAKPELTVSKIPSRVLLISTGIAVGGGIILGFISSAIAENNFAYTDALISSFSVIATWMTARKYIENWLFWLVINAASVALYILKGPSMYLPAVLFIFYTFMSAGGYFAWKKNLRA